MTPRAETLEAGAAKRDVRRAFAGDAVIDNWPAPDGWNLRRYRQPGRGGGKRGALLFLAGRGDFLEKYSETLDGLADQGWNVTTIDWRGQGGSGRLSDTDPWVGHCEGFGPWLDDLQAFYRDWAAEGEGPHVIIGHSMGGHLLLRAMVEDRVRPDAAILIAPMLGLNTFPLPEWLARRIIRLVNRLGLGGRAAWRDMAGSPLRAAQRRARLTHSIDRHDDELWWRDQKPPLAVGGPSWRWLEEASRSIDLVQQSPRIETLDLPVLILATRSDRLVSPQAITSIAARLPDARLHFYGAEAAHEILREVDDVRDDALARIRAFLDERAPAR